MKKLLYILMLLFLGVPLAHSQTTWTTCVTQGGNEQDVCDNSGTCQDGGECSVTQFNAFSGDYSGSTFYFSGTITSQVTPNIYGTAWGANQLTLDGYETDDTEYQDWSEAAGRAKIDCGGSDGIVLNNTNELKYILIADFEITGCGSVGIYIRGTDDGGGDSNNIKMERNFIYECGQGIYLGNDCSYLTVGGSESGGNVVKNIGTGTADVDVGTCAANDVIISYNHLYADSSSWGVDGITFDCAHPSKFLIEYNKIHEHNHTSGGENGIDIKAETTDVIIRYNDIYGHNIKVSGGGSEIILNGNNSYACDDIYIYGNRIHDGADHGIEVQGNNPGPTYDNIYIWSNLIYGIDSRGISVNHAGTYYIYNNTFYENGDDPSTGSHTHILVNNSTVVAKNNIFSEGRPNEADEVQVYVGAGDTTATFDYNTYFFTGEDSIVRWGGDGNNTIAQLATMGAPYGNQEVHDPGDDTDPGFITPGTNFRLDGTHVDNGEDISQCFGVTIQGTLYTICIDDALNPDSTDWTTTPQTVATVKRDVYSWDRGAYADLGAASPPEFNTAVIAATGETITVTFDTDVYDGSDYQDADFNVDCDAAGPGVTLTYVSGKDTATWVFTLDTTILSEGEGDTNCNLDMTDATDAIVNSEDDSMAELTDGAITNNSTQTAGAVTLTTTVGGGGETVTVGGGSETVTIGAP